MKQKLEFPEYLADGISPSTNGGGSSIQSGKDVGEDSLSVTAVSETPQAENDLGEIATPLDEVSKDLELDELRLHGENATGINVRKVLTSLNFHGAGLPTR
jgi:hypothetical protein